MIQEDAALETSFFDLRIPPPLVMTTREELAVARLALARQPDSNALRLNLANFLIVLDHFAEAISLLESWNVDEYRFQDMLAMAWLSRETPSGDLKAKQYAARALELSATPLQRANALALLAKACVRLSEFDRAREHLAEALQRQPEQKDAFKRVVALDLKQGNPDEVLVHAEHMVEQGITHSRVLASQCLAFAQLGMMEEARRAQGLDEFFLEKTPACPAAWESLEAFNHDLAAEIAAHPDIRYERYGTASAHTWRVDQPALRRSRIFPALQRLIQREVTAYAATLPSSDHPFVQGRPRHALLRNWSVITEGDGHETWHVHQNGWLSGVYYAQVQDHIAFGKGVEGCIAFGLPADLIGEQRAAEFGERIVRPRSGLFLLFPSHVYHRTFPHHGDGKRICVAFDIVPAPQGS